MHGSLLYGLMAEKVFNSDNFLHCFCSTIVNKSYSIWKLQLKFNASDLKLHRPTPYTVPLKLDSDGLTFSFPCHSAAVHLRIWNRFISWSIGLLIVFKNDRKNDRFSFRLRKKLSLLKTNNSFWIFKKQNTIVFENDCFFKTIFLFEKLSFLKTTIFKNDIFKKGFFFRFSLLFSKRYDCFKKVKNAPSLTVTYETKT